MDFDEKESAKRIEFLLRSVMSLDSMEECSRFFRDICTDSELEELSKRLEAAKMLNERYIYTEIAEKTGLSTATISRVNRTLKFGEGGYGIVLDRVGKRI